MSSKKLVGTVTLNSVDGSYQPDILDTNHPFVTNAVDLIKRLRTGVLTPLAYHDEVLKLTQDPETKESLAPMVQQTLNEKCDQILYRRTGDTHREAIQMFYLAANVLHPPHCHHNIISTQMMMAGEVHVREYDRVARLTPTTILLRLKSDKWIGQGSALRATETSGNCHWFGASDSPAVMLNFNAYGYQDWTFNPPDKPLLRNLVDPTHGVNPDGLIIALEIDAITAYKKFGGRPLSDFPPQAVASN
jgi:hypothetical protein